jgi:hypothetical protein
MSWEESLSINQKFYYFLAPHIWQVSNALASNPYGHIAR